MRIVFKGIYWQDWRRDLSSCSTWISINGTTSISNATKRSRMKRKNVVKSFCQYFLCVLLLSSLWCLIGSRRIFITNGIFLQNWYPFRITRERRNNYIMHSRWTWFPPLLSDFCPSICWLSLLILKKQNRKVWSP